MKAPQHHSCASLLMVMVAVMDMDMVMVMVLPSRLMRRILAVFLVRCIAASGVATGGQSHPQSRNNIRMVENEGPMTGCLIHRITRYNGFRDVCVRFYFPVLPFRKTIVIIQIGISLEFYMFVVGCSIRVEREMKCA